jgi:hypothetical protein
LGPCKLLGLGGLLLGLVGDTKLIHLDLEGLRVVRVAHVNIDETLLHRLQTEAEQINHHRDEQLFIEVHVEWDALPKFHAKQLLGPVEAVDVQISLSILATGLRSRQALQQDLQVRTELRKVDGAGPLARALEQRVPVWREAELVEAANAILGAKDFQSLFGQLKT